MAPATHIAFHCPGAICLGLSSSSDVLSRLLPLLLVLAFIVVLGGVAISIARRQLLDKSRDEQGPIELEGLRQLRDSGAITRQEYETARDALIGRTDASSRRAERPPQRRTGPEGELTAAPGFDLTGERLPDAAEGDDDDEPDDDHSGPASVPA